MHYTKLSATLCIDHLCHMQRGKVSMAYAPCVDVDSKLQEFTKNSQTKQAKKLSAEFFCRASITDPYQDTPDFDGRLQNDC